MYIGGHGFISLASSSFVELLCLIC